MDIELIDIYLKDTSLFKERILDNVVTEHDLEDELIKYQEKDGFNTYLKEIRIGLGKRLEKISTDKILAFSKRPKTFKSLHIKQVYYEALYQRKDLFIFNRNEINQERKKIMIKEISNFSFDSFFIQMLEDPESCSLLDLQKLYKFNIGINIRDNNFSNNKPKDYKLHLNLIIAMQKRPAFRSDAIDYYKHQKDIFYYKGMELLSSFILINEDNL